MYRILYVDDEASLLEIGKLYLERSGNFEVTTALSAPEGIRLLEQEKFDAIIADYQMPGMDGIQFLVEVRTRFGPIPFILFTGRGREEVVIQAINSGADFYLQKGGDPSAQFAELSHKIKSAASRKRAEDALVESEERYHEFFAVSRDSVFITSPEGRWIDFNDAILEMFGYGSRKEMFELPVPSIYANPDDRSAFIHLMKRDGYVKEYPVQLKKKDGTVIDTLITAVLVRNPDGSLKALFGAIRDVTAWKRAEEDAKKAHEELEASYEQLTATEEEMRQVIDDLSKSERAVRESEQVLSAIVMGSPIPQFVIDRNHRILHWNLALEEYSGISAKEVAGTTQQWRAFYPEERPCMADLLVDGEFEKIPQWYSGRFTKSKLISGAYEATDFFPKLGKTGTWLYFTAAPIRDTEGNIIGAVETLEDITERKRSEEALRESEEKYRNVVEDQTEFICRFLPDGTHIFVNDAYCRYFDRKREDVIGHRFRPRIPPEDREILERYIASITPEHPVIDIDQRIIMPDGGTRWQRWSDRAIFDPDGRVIEYQSVGRDITEYKRAEEELRQANRKLSLLSNFTRHDINNQLTGLVGYLSILEKKLPDPSFTSLFGKINATAERISAMIRFTEEYEKIGINAPAWQNCRTLLDAAAKETLLGQVMVKNDLPAGAEVFADPLIAKVCYNLMDNAARYGGKITTIRFSIEERDGDHVVVCEDDGDGVPAQEKEKIFERGYGKNTGLGLALTREILNITGITIRETGEPGKGARFEMTVPKGVYRLAGTL